MLTIAKFDRYDLVNTPGTDKPAFTLWFNGCSQKCEGCYNPRLWDKDAGKPYESDTVAFTICSECERTEIKDVVLLGGEPMEQDSTSLQNLLAKLHRFGYRIWMYTSWEFEDIPANIKEHLYTIKCGRYDETLKCDGIPSSSNQKFYRNEGKGWREITFKEEPKQ